MMFPSFEYMEWAKTHPADPGVRFNLAGSGFDYADPGVIQPDFGRVRLSGPNFYGSESIRGRIAARYGVPVDHVLNVAGTSLGIFLTVAALLEPGDEVLVEGPAYEHLVKAPGLVGGVVNRVGRGFGSGFRLDVDRIRHALTPNTRLVVVSDLHNPSGRALDAPTRAALLDLAETEGFTLFVDEVYRDFLPGPPGTIYEPGRPVVVASSLTKVYGMGMLRAGWLLGAPEFLHRAARVLNFLHVRDPFPMEPLIEAAFDHADELRARGLETARAGMAVLTDWMSGRSDIQWSPPDGGLVAFPRLPHSISSALFWRRLREEEATLVVPGYFFDDDHHIRLGLAQGPEVVAAGLERVGRLLDAMA